MLEGCLKMSDRRLSSRLRTAFGRLLGRRTKCSQGCSNGGLSLKKPFPNSVGRRGAHGAAELLKSLRFIAGCCSLLQKFPELFCIEKESFYFVPDPHTERSAAAFVATAITTEDTESSDSFLPEILLVVSSEESVAIQCPGLLAVRTRRALEQTKPLISLLLRSENPNRQNDAHIP